LKEQETISINDELIARYLAGEALPSEAIALHEWLEKGENKLYFQDVEQAWHRTNPKEGVLNVDLVNEWKSLRDKFKTTSPETIRTLSLSSIIFRIAAVLVVGFGIAFYFYPGKEPVAVQTITAGKIERVVLADSSVAVLNKESVVSYPEHFGKSREVVLSKGEAFFKVTHNGKPFVVHTAIADIHVIGTAFNVTLSDGHLNVTVEEGKVLVTTPTDSTYLDAGYSGSVVSDTTPIKVSPSEDKNIASYATRKFVFEDTTLEQVFQVMQKAYPYSFTMQNAGIGGCKLTASFDDVTAEYMLHLIAESLNLTIKKNDQGFIIEGKGCP
jgi:transmembrane sensor